MLRDHHDERVEMQRLVDEEETKEEDEEIFSSPTQIKISVPYPYLGITLAILSGILYSLVMSIVKWMETVQPSQLAVCRSLGIMLPALPIVIWRNECPFPKGKRLILISRSLSGTIALILAFTAIQHMPFGDASVLIFCFPVFVVIFARLFLKEPCGIFHVVTICITLIGTVLISRPPFIFGSGVSDQQSSVTYSWWGPAAALLSTLFSACIIIFVRALKGIHFSVIMLNHGTFSLILSIIITWCLGDFRWPKCGTERLLTVALAIFSFGGQILLTIALKLEQAGPVSIARSIDIAFAFIIQIVVFQEVPISYSIIGAILVTVSVLLNPIKTWALALPESSMLRKTFSIFET